MTKKKWKKSSPELVEHFLSTTAPLTEAQPRKMFGYPCCFANGNMFTGLHEENWIIRLPEDKREEFSAKYDAKPFEPMKGRIMKEYLKLPASVLEDQRLLEQWVGASLAYALTLPPKIKK